MGGAEKQSLEDLDSYLSCRAQVCDRCSKMKRKCYGAGEKCDNCALANLECTTERSVKRKRKPKPTKLSPLEIENIKLKLRVEELEAKLEQIRKSYLLSPLYNVVNQEASVGKTNPDEKNFNVMDHF